MARTALHVAPHPDDEILGCGATLLALQAAGWRVVNLACSLGRRGDQDRRRGELDAAVGVLGIEGMVASPPVAMSSGDDWSVAEERVAAVVGTAATELGAELVLSPHPNDGHPAHALVGRAVRDAPTTCPRWWAWGLWRDVQTPNRYVPYGDDVLSRLLEALSCHTGEVARNPYTELLPARARVAAILGSELVHGFGSGPAAPDPYADLLEERVRTDPGGWQLSERQVVGID
jgi:N-acetylglucosamine malate deacetylase 1